VERRVFLGTAAGGLLAAPLAAGAQQAAKVPRIGWLSLNLAPNPHLREALEQGLRDLGYVEGRNVVIEIRDAGGKPERLATLSLLDRWATWHWIRTGLGALGFVAALRALHG
jgi:putative ABC transport system substrate-binding protein